MSRKSKIDAVKKVEIVEQYLNGELSQKGAAKMCGVKCYNKVVTEVANKI